MANKNMRTRNLDHAKPLVVYDAVHDVLPERLDIASGISRTTNTAPTGMEKEEELEHHLQLALTAAQQGDTKHVAIPIPAVVEVEHSLYERLYPSDYKKEAEFYRVQGLSVAGPEPDVVDYCLDEEDDRWLSTVGAPLNISYDRFETIIDRLEKSSGAQAISKEDALKLLNDRSEVVTAIHQYWTAKRGRLGHGLIARVRTENKRDAQSSHDPYVAFRRRAEKMQTRKNRKSDEQNYILMFKLRIAHTQALMRDGIMDVLKSLREREVLKLRTSLVERHEFQLGNVLFGDAIGEMSHHVLENYPEMSRIEAQDFAYSDDEEQEGSDNEGANLDDSLEDFSEVSDSTDSWARLQTISSAPNKGRHFDDETDENVPHPNLLALSDPHYVSESQYRGEEPPEYWREDGEFTFVPRKDCKYIVEEDSPDCDNEEKVEEDEEAVDERFRGYYLQDIPVMSAAKRTVIKGVYARRSVGRNATQYLDYFKLPNELSCCDLQRLHLDYIEKQEEGFSDDKEKAFFTRLMGQEEKVPVYAFAAQGRLDEACVLDSQEERWTLTDEDLEEIYQLALKWQADGMVSVPSTVEESQPLAQGEDWQEYQVACSSVCLPFHEHSYCAPPVFGDLDFLVSESASNEAEDGTNSETATEATESVSLDVAEQEAVAVSAEPPLAPQVGGATQPGSSQGETSPAAATKKKVTVAVKKPRVPVLVTAMASETLAVSSPNAAIAKRTISQVSADKDCKKPTRKRAKAGEGDKAGEDGLGGSSSQSENSGSLPALLGSATTHNLGKTVVSNGTATGLIPLTIPLPKKAIATPVNKPVKKAPVKKEPPAKSTPAFVSSLPLTPAPSPLAGPDKPLNGEGGKSKRKAPVTASATAVSQAKKKKEGESTTTLVSIATPASSSSSNGLPAVVTFPVGVASSLAVSINGSMRTAPRSVVSLIGPSTGLVSGSPSLSRPVTVTVGGGGGGSRVSSTASGNPNLQALLTNGNKTALTPSTIFSNKVQPFLVPPEHSSTPPTLLLPHSVVTSNKLC
ncbi:hypothetical protein RvY_03248 [Ramazzottius varieornatus]|uniref:Enhancer of polycomb-like protein n=1 Tax=Ramazzottius varieornatus TaxID=947166 RepID=A0A1D1UT58_RAMVA|nr:hypothetical protein RvY_03248 [Ramazzottius varieornatus]